MESYPTCKHLSRTKPKLEIDKEKAEEIAKSYRVLPVFETMLYDEVHRRHYSLESNEFLRCRWKEFRDNASTRVHEPFKFFDNRDLHFYKGTCRLIPSESMYNKKEFRKHMNESNVVDKYGPKPIPCDIHVRKFTCLSRKFPKQYPKDAEAAKKDNK